MTKLCSNYVIPLHIIGTQLFSTPHWSNHWWSPAVTSPAPSSTLLPGSHVSSRARSRVHLLQLLRLTFAIILHTPQRGLVWAARWSARVALWCIPSMWCILALWCILSSDQRWNLQPAEVTSRDSAYNCHTRHVSHIQGIRIFFISWYNLSFINFNPSIKHQN